MEASGWERLTEGETGSCSDGWGHAQKIQFSLDGWGCVPSLLLTMVEVMKTMGPPSKGPMQALLHSVPLTLQQATTDPRLCQRLLDTHGQVWVSLLWGHYFFLLGLGVHKVLFEIGRASCRERV